MDVEKKYLENLITRVYIFRKIVIGIAKHLYNKVLAIPAFNEAGELIVDANAIGMIEIKY